jgi:hypothetical protein
LLEKISSQNQFFSFFQENKFSKEDLFFEIFKNPFYIDDQRENKTYEKKESFKRFYKEPFNFRDG